MREAFRHEVPIFGQHHVARTYLELATCVVVVTAAVLVAVARCTSCDLRLPH